MSLWTAHCTTSASREYAMCNISKDELFVCGRGLMFEGSCEKRDPD